jgi:hypothetical protein
MNKVATALFSTVLCLSPLKNSISQQDISQQDVSQQDNNKDDYVIKKEVSTLLDTYWDKNWTLKESDLEKEISKWPQELADYMKDLKYIHVPLYVDIPNGGILVAYYMHTVNSYYIPIMRLNTDNYEYLMNGLDNPVTSNANLNFLKNVNYYGLAVYSDDVKNLSEIKKDLQSYERDVNNFLLFSREGVSHEMTHRLIHDQDGVYSNKDFRMPTDEEFREYALHLLNSEVKNTLLEKYYLYIDMKGYRDMITYYYKDVETFMKEALKDTSGKIKSLVNIYRDYADQEPFIQISANNVFFTNWKESLKDTLDQLFVKEFLSRDITGDELWFSRKNRNSSNYRLKERPYLTLKVTGGEKKIYEMFYEPAVRRLMDQGVKNEEFILLSAYIRDKIIFDLLREETEAFSINSLANVYCSEPTTHMWLIDKFGYDYFSKFQISGKKIFEIFLDKNTIARDLLSKGKDPLEIQAELEFAEEYNHLRTDYEWPKSSISIKIEK